MRRRLIAALEELPGVRVTGWAGAADDAMEAIWRLGPQFVVLDLQLTRGSGLLVLGALKTLDRPPVIAVLTNHPQVQYRRRCEELGADFFFDKAEGLDGVLDACRTIASAPNVAAR